MQKGDATAAPACAPSIEDRRRRRRRSPNCSTVAMTNGSEASPAAPKTTKDILGTPIDPKTPVPLNPNNFDETGAHSESPRVNPNVEILYDGPTEFDPDDDENPTVAYRLFSNRSSSCGVFVLKFMKLWT